MIIIIDGGSGAREDISAAVIDTLKKESFYEAFKVMDDSGSCRKLLRSLGAAASKLRKQSERIRKAFGESFLETKGEEMDENWVKGVEKRVEKYVLQHIGIYFGGIICN